MALPIDFTAIVVRWDALEAHYPGGVDAFCKRNRYFSCDWYLVGINRKTCKEPRGEVSHLIEHGVPEDSIAMLDAAGQPAEPCDWLESGEVKGEQKVWLKEKLAPVARKRDGTPLSRGPKEAGGLTANPPGTPFPPGHPFASPTILFHIKPPKNGHPAQDRGPENEREEDKPQGPD